VLTAETVAVKLALVDPAPTVTEAGTVTAELLLVRLTANPPLGAAALSVTVQLSVPAPVIDPLAQVSALNTGTPVLSCSAKVFATPPALAVNVTVCAVLTAETVAVKLALVDPAPTVTEAGTVTAELLLARLTANPPLGAAALSVTVQLSVPAPVMDPLTQVNPPKIGDEEEAEVYVYDTIDHRPETIHPKSTDIFDPFVGKPFTVQLVDVPAHDPGLRLLEFNVVPTCNWYCVAPLVALHEKVTEEPDNTLPGVGLVIAVCAFVVAPPMRPQNASGRQHDSKMRMWERRI